MTESLRTLMAGLIDYAGLFPPAKLAMPASVETFARSMVGEHRWILGRFICPVSRLREFSQAAAVMLPGTFATSGYREYAGGEPWRLSAIIDGDLHADLDTIAAFNEHHEREDHGLCAVDAVELRVARPEQIDSATEEISDDLLPFFEFPPEVVGAGDCRGFVAALAGHGAGAKIRTGGIVPEAFPSTRAVATFIAACAGAGVPFKATAGLHHPLRAEYPLTYEPSCPRGTMHGFLNVFLAAALVYTHRLDAGRAAEILDIRDADQFRFTDEGVRWNGLFLEVAQIAKAREAFCLSYGSCSFDEPVADLQKLGLL
ncbi:MAG: hypothetical protein KF678_06985 [Phycisphaeraceae bacterium]|nr:hypothetical protein [Phycisphaeraceae bacterium]